MLQFVAAATEIYRWARYRGYKTYDSYQEAAGADALPYTDWAALAERDISVVRAKPDEGSQSIGHGDAIRLINEVLDLVARGYAVYTWYGRKGEVLILGYQPIQLGIVPSVGLHRKYEPGTRVVGAITF